MRFLRAERRIDRAYPRWLRHEPPSAAAPSDLRVSVLMPVHDPAPEFLVAAIDSVRRQIHDSWELCIADDGSRDPAIAAIVARSAADPRVRLYRHDAARGIAAATNAALALATGEVVTMLDHDDVLAPRALACVAGVFSQDPAARMMFSDEDRLAPDGARRSPYFKGAFDPQLLHAQNVVCHLAAYRREFLQDLGGMAAGFDGAQDHELALRAAAACGAGAVRHVPEVLYHWRETPGSVSRTRAAACEDASRRAVAAHLPGARVTPDPALPYWNRVVFDLPDPPPLVSVLLAGAGTPALDPAYPLVEILDPATPVPRGEVVLLLDPSLRAAAPGWLRELVSRALAPGAGVVGARIDRPSGRIAHAGYVLDPRRVVHDIAGWGDADDPGYRGMYRLPRQVSAVSGRCLAIRTEAWHALGGAGEGPFAAVDLCLRAGAAGLRVEWTPYARLSGPAAPLPRDRGFARKWAAALAHEAWLSPHLRAGSGGIVLRPGRAEKAGKDVLF